MSKVFGVMNSLSVSICKDASDAIQQGYFYRPPVFEPIEIDKVVVVKEGMQNGQASVDLVMVDAKGQKYVCMVSAALLKSIPLEF